MIGRECMKCAVCKNNQLIFLFRLDDLRSVRRCSFCGLTQVAPLPSIKDVAGLYHENIDHFTPYLEQLEVHRRYFQQKISQLTTYNSQPTTILDVGCALGVLLEEAQKVGWKAVGIDISKDAVSYCTKKGLKAFQGTLTTFARGPLAKGVRFDCVTAFEVIEHERDPLGMIQSIFKLLKPGGIAVMTTPNHNGWGRRLMGKWWPGYQHPEHLFFFDPDSIIYLFRKAGFSVVEVRNDSPRPFPLSFAFTRAADYFPLLKSPLKAIGNLLDHWKLINPLNPWNGMLVVVRKGMEHYNKKNI